MGFAEYLFWAVFSYFKYFFTISHYFGYNGYLFFTPGPGTTDLLLLPLLLTVSEFSAVATITVIFYNFTIFYKLTNFTNLQISS
jgi:membrane protein DedA with SNARE-associated domain